MSDTVIHFRKNHILHQDNLVNVRLFPDDMTSSAVGRVSGVQAAAVVVDFTVDMKRCIFHISFSCYMYLQLKRER